MKIVKRIAAVIGTIIGLISIIQGSNLICLGSKESFKAYGGDAYTGIQNGTAQTANNIYYLGEFLEDALSLFFVILGLLIILVSAYIFIGTFFNKQSNPAPAYSKDVVIPSSNERAYAASSNYYVAPSNTYAAPPYVEPKAANPANEGLGWVADCVFDDEVGENQWKCPACGRVNENYVGTCGCGRSKNDTSPVVKKPSEPPALHVRGEEPAPVVADNQWMCPMCGAINQNYVGTCGCGHNKPLA